MIHHIAGFIQIAKTQCAVLHTLCIRMKKYSCLSYGSKQIYIHNLSRIYFVIKDTRWWKHENTRLFCWVLIRSISIAVVDATGWLLITFASNVWLHAFWMWVIWTDVWCLPLDTYELHCSTDILYLKSKKSMLLLAVAIVVIRCPYRHSTQVNLAWDYGINTTMQIREPCIVFNSLHTTSCI